MSYEDLKEKIKEHEGFRDQVYKDSLGFATIGYGHLVLSTDPFKQDGHILLWQNQDYPYILDL